MSRLFGDRLPPEVKARADLARGERVLAHAATEEGSWLLGTRDALVVVADQVTRLPWERVETADWDRESDQLRVAEVGEFGRVRPVHTFTLAEPGRLLAMVRERVTASVLLQRRVVVSGKRGLSVIARRPPGGGETTWACELDEGVDPADPEVRALADQALRAAQDELGVGRPPI